MIMFMVLLLSQNHCISAFKIVLQISYARQCCFSFH